MGPLFTFDLEDSSGDYRPNGRFVQNTLRYLDFLDEINVLGTFFVVAKAAKVAPALIHQLASRGHEVASHSLAHQQLHLQDVKQFHTTEREAKDILEQASGMKVQGFRAPVFSLVRKTVWALDILKALNYSYSSSTIPCSNPLNGFPGIPNVPFIWPNGLVEFPCPICTLGPVAVPYLGGIYLRYFPAWLIRQLMQMQRQNFLWTYVHPYDIDSTEAYFRMPGTTTIVSLLLWINRAKTLDKLSTILIQDKNLRFFDLVGSDDFHKTLQQIRRI